MTNANENNPNLERKPEAQVEALFLACKGLQDGSKTIDEALTDIDTAYSLSPDPLLRGKTKSLLASADSLDSSVRIASSYALAPKVSEVDKLSVEMETGRKLVEVNQEHNARLAVLIDLYKFVQAKGETDDGFEISTLEALFSVIGKYENHIKRDAEAKKEVIRAEKEEQLNKLVADSFEGTSEAVPNTIEELLGDIDKK